MVDLVIVGIGEFAEMAFERFTKDSPYKVVAFSVESAYIKNSRFLDLPVVPFEELEEFYPPHNHQVFIAITYSETNRLREMFYRNVKKKGYRLATYISSQALVSDDIQIGENCFIFEFTNILYSVKIGDNTIVWSGCYIGDHSRIDDNCFLGARAVVACHSCVGRNCFIGINSTVINDVQLSDYSVIGAGAVVVRDTSEERVYVGNPARPLDNRHRIKAHTK